MWQQLCHGSSVQKKEPQVEVSITLLLTLLQDQAHLIATIKYDMTKVK